MMYRVFENIGAMGYIPVGLICETIDGAHREAKREGVMRYRVALVTKGDYRGTKFVSWKSWGRHDYG